MLLVSIPHGFPRPFSPGEDACNGNSRAVSIPHGFPRPFSPVLLPTPPTLASVSIPHGFPRPFSRGCFVASLTSSIVSIPHGFPRPFSRKPHGLHQRLRHRVSIPHGFPRPFSRSRTAPRAGDRRPLFQFLTDSPGHLARHHGLTEQPLILRFQFLTDSPGHLANAMQENAMQQNRRVSIPHGFPRPFSPACPGRCLKS